MSTAATETQGNLEALNNALDQQVLGGDILGAFEKYYAEDVVMVENFDTPKVGKDVNRDAEKQFLGSVAQFHGARVLSTAVNERDGVSFSEWEMDVTFKEWGRKKMNQVAVRQWKNGQIVHERFYYKG